MRCGRGSRPEGSASLSPENRSRRRLHHKSDVGGVRLGLEDDVAVRLAYDDIIARLGMNSRFGEQGRQAASAVQLMAPAGVELICGGPRSLIRHSARPVWFGLGGVSAEVLDDECLRPHPHHLDTACLMIQEIKGAPTNGSPRRCPL